MRSEDLQEIEKSLGEFGGKVDLFMLIYTLYSRPCELKAYGWVSLGSMLWGARCQFGVTLRRVIYAYADIFEMMVDYCSTCVDWWVTHVYAHPRIGDTTHIQQFCYYSKVLISWPIWNEGTMADLSIASTRNSIQRDLLALDWQRAASSTDPETREIINNGPEPGRSSQIYLPVPVGPHINPSKPSWSVTLTMSVVGRGDRRNDLIVQWHSKVNLKRTKDRAGLLWSF